MQDAFRIEGSGIVCDNTNCDYEDRTVTNEDLKNHIDSKCPKCGDVLLTQADCDAFEKLLSLAKFLNSVVPQVDETSPSLGSTSIGLKVHDGQIKILED